MMIEFTKLDVYITGAIGGLVTGITFTLGQYFASQHIIKKTKRLFKRIK